jgi:glutathione peroxidase
VTSEYDVDFPMFAKIEVNGDGAAPLYQMLKAAQPGDGDSAEITWNFEKFLVDEHGEVVRRFPPTTTPDELVEIVPEYL